MSFMFSPLPGVTASNWSLQADLKPSTEFKGRPAYFVFYQRGLVAPPWTFSIDFKVDIIVFREIAWIIQSDFTCIFYIFSCYFQQNQNAIVLAATIAVAGSHIDTKHFSPDFKLFMKKFPSWAFISPRASELKIWEI